MAESSSPPPAFDYPALFDSADTASKSSQTKFFLTRGVEYAALAVGAVVGSFTNDFVWGAGPIVGLLLFLLALIIRVSKYGETSERAWYDARAASESIKSASWQYAVGGESYRLADHGAKQRYLDSLKQVLEALPQLDVGVASQGNAGVTASMDTVRDRPLDDRKTVYLESRVNDQITWYATKAATNKLRSTQWRRGLIGIEAIAILGGILQIRDVFDFGLLGILAAIAASVAAWQQTKNYTALSEAYAVTSHEVNLVADTITSATDEGTWAQSVHDAEAAFSREHTMWLARRQGPGA